MKTKKAAFLSILTLLASLAVAQAATWHVDAKGIPEAGGTSAADAFPSLQTAIDRAGDGDLILVEEGTYAPVSVASSRSFTIRSTGGAENTFLVGDGKTRCATLTDETADAAWWVTLEGFTLTDGVDASDLGGGGVFGGNLVNCILRDNAAVRGGAASGSRLENCLLVGNVAALGGGAFDSELVNCTVVGNRADGTGGGVCRCELANCIVQANTSPDGADAVASVAVRSCTTPLLDGEGNSAADAGFADAAADDWRLAKGSPCLDAGDAGFCTSAADLAGNGRVAGGGVDLGAYEGAVEPMRKAKRAATAAAKTITIWLNPNGGTCNPRKMTFRVGAKYSGLPTPIRPGYAHIGWYTASKGGTRITGKTSVSTSQKKLYAHWAREVTVSFHPKGGSCPVKRKTYAHGQPYGSFPTPTRTGHRWTGWYTPAGKRVKTTTPVTYARTNLYAHWTPVVTVSFHPNGGSCSVKRKTYVHGQPYGSFPTPTRAGYRWTGWYTPAGKRVKTTTPVTYARTNLYARWAREVTVSFDPNGGSCPVKRKTYVHGQPYGSFPTPTRSGYTWTGWYTPAGIRVKTTTSVTYARTNLVAHWNKNISVHPVGDSMTYGVRTRHNPLLNGASASAVAQIHNQGWRGYLNRSLASAGKAENRNVVFLGKHPQSSYAGNVPHDGYCGESASAYARNHRDACAVAADVQIVFLGMNDALAISRKDGDFGSYFVYTQDGYARVLSSLHAGTTTPLTILVTEPEVTSLVSAHNPLYNPGDINHVIAGYINPYVRSQQGPKVKILDLQSLYSNSSYTDDGFHLSVEGNQVIARRLAEMIEGFQEWK